MTWFSPRNLTHVWMLWACSVLCGLGLPLPEEVLALYAGASIADGTFSGAQVWVALTSGLLIRDVISWGIGRLLGERLHSDSSRIRRWIGADNLDRAAHAIGDNPVRTVLLGRVTIGMRPPYFVIAGASGVPFATLLLVDSLGLFATTTLLIVVGYAVGPTAIATFQTLSPGPMIGLLILAIAAFAWRKRLASRTDDTPT